MKKILLFCFAISAILFTACQKEESTESGSESTDGYTLTITPSTVTIGEDMTLTVTGDGAEDLEWLACFEGPISNCLMYPITGGELVYNVSSALSAGEYTFHAASGDLETNSVTVTIVE